ncbi:gag-pol polyprotein, partial [Trifolium pratense]
MKKAISEEAIRGLPKLKIKEGNICGKCQIGKQTLMSHQKMQHRISTKVLELLHMDFMGPMQVESLSGKRNKSRSFFISYYTSAKWPLILPGMFIIVLSRDPLCDEGIFLGYSINNKAYRVYKSITKTMMESVNMVIDDTGGDKTTYVADDAITSDLQNDLQDDEPVTVMEPETNTE